MAAIYSVELSRDSADFLLIKKQAGAAMIGVAIIIGLSRVNHLFLRSYGRVIYAFGLLLMLSVLIFGADIRGTTGWFQLGIFSFQPVEFMKLALAIQLARYYSERARRRFGWRELFGSAVVAGVPVLLTLMQPDVGSAVLLIGIWATITFFAGVRVQHVAALLVFTVLVSAFSWSFLLKPYQKERVEVFLNPAADPLASGYNIAQAQIAIGSGQLFGRGLGFGSQSQLKFLPESQTDFIFAVIAEELGFFGVCVVLLTLALLCWRIMRIARLSGDHFTSFLAVAILGAIFFQASVNIAVNLAIFPTTGIALPFMSYGGSSLLFSLIMIGVIESIAIRLRPGDTELA
jgi:rod shape determining protein RodA